MTTPVANAARIVAELRDRLKSEYGLDDGDEALETTLEGETDLPELLAMMARDAVQAEDYAEATKGRIKLLSERKSTLEARSEKLRNAIAWALTEAGWNRIPSEALPDMGPVTLSYPKQQKLEISDEVFVPAFLKRQKPTEFVIDREGLRKWLEDGGECIGARLKNAQPVLTIRSK
jgi:hypothetical protein